MIKQITKHIVMTCMCLLLSFAWIKPATALDCEPYRDVIGNPDAPEILPEECQCKLIGYCEIACTDLGDPYYNSAQCKSYRGEGAAGGDCSDRNSSIYNSDACIRQRLGFQNIDTNHILVERNPTDLITITFRLLLAIVVIIVVGRLALSGMSVANAKEDSDKRSDAMKKVSNSLVGMIVTLSSLGLTNFLQTNFGGGSDREILKKCEALELDNYPEEIVQRCNNLKFG